ncbi:hypothetical protein Dimus_035894 [Dionaea muscipula]
MDCFIRSGSKPFTVISREMGGKDGNPPTLETMYFETRRQKMRLWKNRPQGNMIKLRKLGDLNPPYPLLTLLKHVSSLGKVMSFVLVGDEVERPQKITTK